ncbi:hypothetical protein [Nonomuraea sp. NPDC048826]|uniref:hypothetical protein n=1 Tax=Nonomuraea sp. NPDC048826 TaxID=3364347 RepID=UPI00371F1363
MLQGTYAHLGVPGFWRRQRMDENGLHAQVEFAHRRQAAFEAARTLLGSGRRGWRVTRDSRVRD